MPAVIVPLRSKRRERALLVQKLQHGAPAIVLFFSGLRTLGGEPHGVALALALFEIAASVLLAISMARALRTAKRPVDAAAAPHHHHGVDWVDVFTAAVLFAEAWERYHETSHIARPTILLGLTLLTIGLLHGKITTRAQHRLTLRVDDEELYVGGKPFRSLRAKWNHVRSIEIGERYGTITLANGRVRRLDLPDLEGSNHVRAALAAAQQRLNALPDGVRPQPDVP
jgi:hypothetical protein